MPSAAKKLAIVHNDEPAPEASVEVVLEESSVETTLMEIQPLARGEELRLLEALLLSLIHI